MEWTGQILVIVGKLFLRVILISAAVVYIVAALSVLERFSSGQTRRQRLEFGDPGGLPERQEAKNKLGRVQ